jgi:hypothetical protein
MPVELLGFMVGLFFGAFLFLGGLADPDKIIGTLRLREFHAMRVIAVFVLVGMVGTYGLELLGAAHLNIKPAHLVSVSVGGALLGIGFGLTGYCPGTGLACAAAGRVDALVSVAGMLGGALVYILIYRSLAVPLERVADYSAYKTLTDATGISKGIWVAGFAGLGVLVLGVTSLGRRRGN